MRPANPRPSVVGDVLATVLKRVDPDRQLRAYALWTFWNEEVGAAVAQRAQPTHLRNGVLFVTVASHSWMQELRFMKDTIRARLNARLGADLVHDIFFNAGAIEPPPTAPSPPAPTPSGRGLIPLPPLADPQLAAAFTRIVQARARRLARGQNETSPARTKKPR